MRKITPKKGAVSAALYTAAAFAVCAALYFLPLRFKPAAVEYPERTSGAYADRYITPAHFVERVRKLHNLRLYETAGSGNGAQYKVQAENVKGEAQLTLYTSDGRAYGFMFKAQAPREPEEPGENPSEIARDLYRRRLRRYHLERDALTGIFEALSLALDSGGGISPDERAKWRFMLAEALKSGSGKEDKGGEYRFSIHFFEYSGQFELYLISDSA